MALSQRTGWDLTENSFAAAVREHRASGRVLLDLTVANPTNCGFSYDAKLLLAPLAQYAALAYEPSPFGIEPARQAVAQYYADHGAPVALDRICLTTSTSEAYSFLFRLLCDPEDDVFAAKPSYPLFDFIAQLDSVRLRDYALWWDPHSEADNEVAGWSMDLQHLEASITPHTKAVIVVHPNNPTGNYARREESEALAALCSRHGLALIVDEVFLDYAVEGRPAQSFAAAQWPCLTFVLSGLSKVCGLPQMKCSWIVALGPAALVDEALARLELIADTYLSVSSVAQHALPVWLASRASVQQQIRHRLRENLQMLDERLAGVPSHRLPVEAGWTVLLRVPADVEGGSFALTSLERGVLTQPGSFYGLSDSRVVLSLLTPPEIWKAGLQQLPLG